MEMMIKCIVAEVNIVTKQIDKNGNKGEWNKTFCLFGPKQGYQ